MRLILRQKEARGTRGKADFSAKKREMAVSGLAKKRRNMCATTRVRREIHDFEQKTMSATRDGPFGNRSADVKLPSLTQDQKEKLLMNIFLDETGECEEMLEKVFKRDTN